MEPPKGSLYRELNPVLESFFSSLGLWTQIYCNYEVLLVTFQRPFAKYSVWFASENDNHIFFFPFTSLQENGAERASHTGPASALFWVEWAHKRATLEDMLVTLFLSFGVLEIRLFICCIFFDSICVVRACV